MARQAKLSPVDAFCANMADAHHLVRMAEALTNPAHVERVGRFGSGLGPGHDLNV